MFLRGNSTNRLDWPVMLPEPPLTSILENLPDAVLVVDGNGYIAYTNSMLEVLLGWRPSELLGQSVNCLIPGSHAAHDELRKKYMLAPDRRLMKPSVQLCAKHCSGTEVPVFVSLSPLDVGATTFVIAVMHDARRQSTIILDELNLLSVAVNAAGSGVVITNAEGLILSVNPAVTTLTGYSREELLGKNPRILKSGKHDVSYYQALWSTVKAGKVWNGQIVNRRKDGSEYYEDQTIAPVLGRDGNITNFIAIKQDISERVRAEQALRETRDELARRIAEIERLHAQVREQAIRDSLTGLFNRRYLDETLPRELAKAEREGSPITLVMLDIDYFKHINDTHGHIAGDSVLAALGELLLKRSRGGDIACRFGGEEFVVVLQQGTCEDGSRCAEAWRQQFAGLTFNVDGDEFSATLSGGVAEWTPGESVSHLLSRVDVALYRAKHEGRDRVTYGIR